MNNVCIVGYGAIGPIHAEAIKKTENARLCAVCDIDQNRLRTAEIEHGVKVFGDFSEVINCGEIDSVHICTPHYLHFDMILGALNAGKKVVAEKPITMTKEEFCRLKDTKDSDKVCCVLQNRYNPCIAALKDIIRSGEYGIPVAVRANLAWHRDKAYYDSGEWRGKLATEGGSLLINQAVHTLDMMTYLVGKIRKLRANSMNYSLENVIETEDTMTACMTFETGARGVFFATNAYGTNSAPELEIVFKDKKLNYADGKLFTEGRIIAEDNSAKIGKSYWGTGHEQLIRRFYDKGEYFSPESVQDTMDAMFAMYESASHGGKEISI